MENNLLRCYNSILLWIFWHNREWGDFMMKKRGIKRIVTIVLAFAVMLTTVLSYDISAQAAATKVTTKQYTISHKAGTYTAPLKLTLTAKKGYKVYYTTGKSLSVKQILKSKKSKVFTLKANTTLKVYAVKNSKKITKKSLTSKSAKKKTKSYAYKIKPAYVKPKGEVFTSSYVISKKAGTYTSQVKITVYAVKGYKVYYTTGTELSAKQIIASEKNKSFTFKTTTTLRIYAVKSSQNVTAQQLASDTTVYKAKKYTYTIKSAQDPQKDVPTKEIFGSDTSGTLVSDVNTEEKSVDVTPGQEVTITAEVKDSETGAAPAVEGDVKVTIPAGTFEENTKVTVNAVDGKVDIKKEGEEYTRLNEFITVQIPMNEIPKEQELDFYKAAYYFGNKTYFIDPDREQLKKGILEFQTCHLCWFGTAKLSEAEMRRRVANKQAVDEVTLQFKQEWLMNYVNDYVGETLRDGLGLSVDSKAYGRITRAFSQSAEVYNLMQSAKAGDRDATLRKLTEITINTLCENPEYLSQTKVNIAGSIAGSATTLFQAMKGEKTKKEAAVEVMKAFSSNLTSAKMYFAARGLWEKGVDWYTDYEMDSAYQAFRGEIVEGEHGFSMRKDDGSGNRGWDYVYKNMQTTLNQKVKQYCDACPDKMYTEFTKEEKDEIRKQIWKQTQEMFEYRYKQEKAIAAAQARKEQILSDLTSERLLDILFYGQFCDNDYELMCERMIRIYEGIEKMLGEENLALLGSETQRRRDMRGMTRAFIEASWDNGESGLGGREAVRKYMQEKYNVDIDDVNVALSATELSIAGSGNTASLILTGAGSSSTTWSSSNSGVASVKPSEQDHNSAIITAKGEGLCRIFARHSGKTYECWVTVTGQVIDEGTEEMYICSHYYESVYLRGITVDLDPEKNSKVEWIPGNLFTIEDVYRGLNNASESVHLIAGKTPGVSKLTAVVDGKETHIWTIIVKDIDLEVTVGSVGHPDPNNPDNNVFEEPVDYVFTDANPEKNIVEMDIDKWQTLNIKLGEYNLSTNKALFDDITWSIDDSYFETSFNSGGYYKNKNGVPTGYSAGRAMYTGDTVISVSMPGLRKNFSFLCRITGTYTLKSSVETDEDNHKAIKISPGRVQNPDGAVWSVEQPMAHIYWDDGSEPKPEDYYYVFDTEERLDEDGIKCLYIKYKKHNGSYHYSHDKNDDLILKIYWQYNGQTICYENDFGSIRDQLN